jgi:hypothetical protein
LWLTPRSIHPGFVAQRYFSLVPRQRGEGARRAGEGSSAARNKSGVIDRDPFDELSPTLHRATAMVRALHEVVKARKPAPDWSERMISSMKDEPAFEDMFALGRSIHHADGPTEDQAP